MDPTPGAALPEQRICAVGVERRMYRRFPRQLVDGVWRADGTRDALLPAHTNDLRTGRLYSPGCGLPTCRLVVTHALDLAILHSCYNSLGISATSRITKHHTYVSAHHHNPYSSMRAPAYACAADSRRWIPAMLPFCRAT